MPRDEMTPDEQSFRSTSKSLKALAKRIADSSPGGHQNPRVLVQFALSIKYLYVLASRVHSGDLAQVLNERIIADVLIENGMRHNGEV